jgi:peptide chain release factor 1
LKFEAGVHRVQRVPQTETQDVFTHQQRLLWCFEAEEFDVQIDMNDVRVDFSVLQDQVDNR